jgi:cellulose synthase/poly-beta-1,6-N-acetylglucosamine synthase-like glycosyltransferase
MVLFSFSLAGLYLIMQISYWYYWNRLPDIRAGKDFEPQTNITVVIPARNEANNISDCVESVLSQQYPIEKLEVIVVDDHSSDGMQKYVQSLFGEQVRYLSLEDAKLPGGKKNALEAGFNEAKGDWMITLDADCLMKGDCLKTSVFAYEKMNAQIITGAVLIEDVKDPFESFQSMEMAGLMLITGSGFSSGWHHLANGAFLSFSKKAFNSEGGYSAHTAYASGDDMFLMESIAEKSPERVFFLKNSDTRVITRAEGGWSSFIKQRTRWASKNSGLKNQRITWIWGFIWIYNLILISSFIGSLLYFRIFIVSFIVLLGAKMVGDMLILVAVTHFFKTPFKGLHFLIAEFIQIGYVVRVGIARLAGKKEYLWKGRKVQ